LGIDSALWTRRAVQELIAQQYHIEIPIRTIGDYLSRDNYIGIPRDAQRG
jgi:Winged helix-turn helix